MGKEAGRTSTAFTLCIYKYYVVEEGKQGVTMALMFIGIAQLTQVSNGAAMPQPRDSPCQLCEHPTKDSPGVR